MGIRKFGIKEAKRADVFAKTGTQRETVLAVVRMLNIPVVIKEQVKARVSKLELAFKKKKAKVRKLKAKFEIIDIDSTRDLLKKADTLNVGDNWNI